MEDKFNLQRFIDAQRNTYENALKELNHGKKSSHWMWYVFPQYIGLGSSAVSIKYAIRSREEAMSYLMHPILGSRLVEITNVLLSIENLSAFDLFGHPDDLKLKSSMTLFGTIQAEQACFDSVLERYFAGNRCILTMKALSEE